MVDGQSLGFYKFALVMENIKKLRQQQKDVGDMIQSEKEEKNKDQDKKQHEHHHGEDGHKEEDNCEDSISEEDSEEEVDKALNPNVTLKKN